MSKERKVVYEPHPVSPKRKAELIAQGCKIIDARFAPASEKAVEGSRLTDEQERASLISTLSERGIQFDAAMPTDELRALTITPQSEPDGLDDLDAEQLHALAKERGVKVHHAAGADKVRAALRENQGE